MRREQATTADGDTVYIDREASERGSVDLFHPVYCDADGEKRWGYYCNACGGFDNAMDTMGRLVCNSCSNIRKPDEWDAAHE
jgi:hypothetical protein